MRSRRFEKLQAVIALIVFTLLDLLDSVLCIVYAFLDDFIEEGISSPCYCHKRDTDNGNKLEENRVSETLYGRRNTFRETGFLKFKGEMKGKKVGRVDNNGNRWSDCRCESCVSWMKNNGDDLRLHVVVQEPLIDTPSGNITENVVFLHGFISSSSFWTQTVFRSLSDDTKRNYRLFAVDLLGFGTSPKPRNCLYTLDDHVEMIEKSVIFPMGLKSFHLVAHSMGSIIALALAAKHPLSVRTVTLIAPPCVSSSKDGASFLALRKLADKKLWPPIAFGASFMSWYEHLGRTVCFIICKHHRIWEFLLRQLTRQRELHFLIKDITKHTHHSAWHTMHNVICGAAKHSDECLDILSRNGVKMTVIQGDQDQIVPLECTLNIKTKIPDANVKILRNRDHITVVLHQTEEFIVILENIWRSCS